MPIRISIFFKLLMLIVPLVCIPAAAVGYFSVQASVERVNRLVRQEQMDKVESTARKINQAFSYCRTDLEIIAQLPILEDYHLARTFRLEAEAGFNRANLEKLFRDFLTRIPFYARIRLLDRQGRELITVPQGQSKPAKSAQGGESFFRQTLSQGPGRIFFSRLQNVPGRKDYVIYAATPFVTGWREMAGVLVIDLAFEKITQMVHSIQVGNEGYSFLLDHMGRVVIHPRYPPYALHQGNTESKSLKKVVRDMMAGNSGWESYVFNNREKIAAYAPIPVMKWSLAVTIPVEEFGKEAGAIRENVVHVVLITLVIALLGVSLLSYNLLRPVRRLVAATNRLARGDLKQEIAVQTHDELGDLTRSFNRMTRELAKMQTELVRSEKLVSLGRLSAGVAHEIRNPLNAMKGAMVHLGQRCGHEPLVRQYTGLVSEEIDRLNRVVSDFLFFSKQAPPARKQIRLNQSVLHAQEILAAQAREAGVDFENHLDPNLPEADLDPYQLEQVLLNLIINALDASRLGGRIIFTTAFIPSPGGGGIELCVKDQGRGIGEEDMPNIFDPFFTTKEDGTGLGLPLSLGIVENHGGSLTLESEPGRGTIARLRFPLGAEEEDPIEH